MKQRFPMRLSPLWLPLLVLFGATPGRSFVEIDEISLLAKFGFFRHAFPLDDIEVAKERNWSILSGIGWRTDLVGLIGLIGSRKNVVEIKFRSIHRVNMIIPRLSCNRLAVSLNDPKLFLISLEAYRKGSPGFDGDKK